MTKDGFSSKMSSNAIRGIRRKKSSLSEVKVAVIGAPGVGKSALTVRFLTRRYIGEYDHQAENRYKNEMMVDGEPVLFEIIDTCPKNWDELVTPEVIHWADGYLLVYSITDHCSLDYIRRVKQHIWEVKGVSNSREVSISGGGTVGGGGGNSPGSSVACCVPMVLVGNKADMVHLRQVTAEEGENVSKEYECSFLEVTAAEQVLQVAEVFHELCREVHNARRKSKQSLLDRVLGSKAGTRVYARGKSDSALPKE